MKRYQIFISYRRDGGELLGQLLHDRLTQEGYSVFFDVESLRSGKFNDELYRVMEECTDVIVVLPPNALNRCSEPEDWVRKEISFCIAKKKNIIPVMMRGFEFPEALSSDINDIRNYNGITANEISSFPYVLEKLTEKFLHSKPSRQNKSKASSDKNGGAIRCVFDRIRQIAAICVLALPYATQWLHLKFDWLPDEIERYVNLYVNFDLRWMTLLIIITGYLLYRFVLKSEYEYIQKIYESKNIDEKMLNYSFDSFISSLLSIDFMASIAKGRNSASEFSENYSKYQCFNSIEVGSTDGSKVDYLYIDFFKLPNPDDICVLYLDKQTGKQRAINFLSKQGFVYSDEKEDILHFKKDDITVKLAYTEAGMTLLACEITRDDALSQIREKTYEVWNHSFARETRLAAKAGNNARKRFFKYLQDKFLSLDIKKQRLILGLAALFFIILFIAGAILLKTSPQTVTSALETGKAFLNAG